MRGVVDYYYDHGQLVARKWPRPSRQPHSTAQKQHWEHLARMRDYVHRAPAQWKHQIGVCSESPTQSVDDRARWCAWRLTETSLPHPLPVVLDVGAHHPAGAEGTRVEVTIPPESCAECVDVTMACMASTAEDTVLRWIQNGYACGRRGQRRPLIVPPVSSMLLPVIWGSRPGLGELWAFFNTLAPFLWIWLIYSSQQRTFTGAAWHVPVQI